ncbi:MAG: rRNA maturation RNase YbeY [Bacteroidales bacterium]|nr:rRNA maturation RNase YbeY [Bacteroidales bacterium]
MAIQIVEEDITFRKIKRSEIKELVRTVVEREGGITGDLSIVFCSDQFLLGINKTFLNRDYLTDVISFDYREDDRISGDILISVERVKENAGIYQVTFPDEMRRIIIHGVLHLVGYEDDTKENRDNMTAKENLYLGIVRAEGK